MVCDSQPSVNGSLTVGIKRSVCEDDQLYSAEFKNVWIFTFVRLDDEVLRKFYVAIFQQSTRAIWQSRGLVVRRYYAEGNGNCFAKLWWEWRSSGVIFIPITVVRVWVTIFLTEPSLGWLSNYQDNARPHTAKVAMDALTEISGSPSEHQPYRPDLTPYDFWAFPTMKRELWCKKLPVPLSSWSLRQTVCSTFLRSGWSVVRSASLAKGTTSERDRHCTSTKFRLGIIRWVHELFKRPSNMNKWVFTHVSSFRKLILFIPACLFLDMQMVF
jgi:hypothetical protein